MSRRYADPIEVWNPAPADRDDLAAPQEFRWRRRRYRVRAVLARWIEADAWWTAAVPAQSGPLARQRCDRVVWRVEAADNRQVGVYDLCHVRDGGPRPERGPPDDCDRRHRDEPPQHEWFLVRALD